MGSDYRGGARLLDARAALPWTRCVTSAGSLCPSGPQPVCLHNRDNLGVSDSQRRPAQTSCPQIEVAFFSMIPRAHSKTRGLRQCAKPQTRKRPSSPWDLSAEKHLLWGKGQQLASSGLSSRVLISDEGKSKMP